VYAVNYVPFNKLVFDDADGSATLFYYHPTMLEQQLNLPCSCLPLVRRTNRVGRSLACACCRVLLPDTVAGSVLAGQRQYQAPELRGLAPAACIDPCNQEASFGNVSCILSELRQRYHGDDRGFLEAPPKARPSDGTRTPSSLPQLDGTNTHVAQLIHSIPLCMKRE